MIKDPEFAKCVESVALDVKIEGGYRKPELMDLFAVQVVMLPFSMYKWGKKYYRRHYSKIVSRK